MSPATIRAGHLPVRRFAAWPADEGEIGADPFLGPRSPRLDVKVVEPLTDDQLRWLITACQPSAGATPQVALRHRRDEASVRLMLETGARAGEVVAMTLDDPDLAEGAAVIRRGKGGKGRVVPFGPHVAKGPRPLPPPAPPPQARRHLARPVARRRRQAVLLRRPAQDPGGAGRHCRHHRVPPAPDAPHTAAHRWLAAGGSETGLMAVAGWARPDMLLRFTRAQASAKAAVEARTLNLGEL